MQAGYNDEPFIKVLDVNDPLPATAQVRGSNHCVMGIYQDRQADKMVLVSVIDNLVKGASGQAIQNMNLMLGLEETTGLLGRSVFP